MSENTVRAVESQQSSENVIEALRDGFVTAEYRKDGTFNKVNKHFEELFGFTLSDISGKHHNVVCDPQDAETFEYKKMWQDLGAGAAKSGQFKRKNKDGKIVLVNSSFVPIKDEKGTVTKIVELSTDITAASENSAMKQMVDLSPINTMMADTNGIITYLNKNSIETLKKLEKHLPVKVDDIVGQKIDIFHKDPEHQQRIIRDPKNLPHRATITLGDEQLDLNITPIFDNTGTYIGPMVTWEVITEKLKIEQKVAEYTSMIENAPINIMYADREGIIRYLNPKSKETLKKIEKDLPVAVDQIEGGSYDVFHKNPAHQRNILKDPRNLPHQAIIEVGEEKLDLLVSPIYDKDGQFMGPMVTWEVVTEKLKNQEAIARMESMVANAPINIMMADLDFNINFANPATINQLKKIQHLLPIRIEKQEDLVGQSIDIFHKNPAHQRQLLSNDKNLPHHTKIKLGDETLDLLASPIYDNNNNYIGPMVTWDVVTDRENMIANITEAADQLASAATELSATAEQLTQNADNTNSELNRAASASTQLSTGVQSVAASAEELNAAVSEIAKNVNESSSLASKTSEQAKKTNDRMKELDTSSSEIGNVTKLISSIAQQTNLLALNATIEAARAGDAGRGFAVVANEVKELANQTASATDEISTKVSGIQDDSKHAVDAIETIGQSIESLNNIAGSISASVEEQRATTAEVARIIGESASGVNEISENIQNITKASEATSAGANQILSAAHGLKDLASKLTELLSNIKK